MAENATFARCPRCNYLTLRTDRPALNALSRKDNETYVCSDCGTDEALTNVRGGRDADVWPNYPEPIEWVEA